MAVTHEAGGPVLARAIPGIARALPLLQRLAQCREGAALVEFAFALPVLLLLFLGMFEIAMVMFVSTSVEGGLREAARFGITGQITDPEDREQAIIDMIEAHTFGFVNIEASDITFMTYDSFNKVGEPEPWGDADGDGVKDEGESYTDVNKNGQWDEDQGTAGLGDAGTVVRYSIEYDWNLLTPYLSALLGDDGVFHMSSSITVRNEPYDFTGGTGG